MCVSVFLYRNSIVIRILKEIPYTLSDQQKRDVLLTKEAIKLL